VGLPLSGGMKIGPCAAESYEPREVRKEAAVSSRFWVPQDLLVRAVRLSEATSRVDGRCTTLILFLGDRLSEHAELPATKAKSLLGSLASGPRRASASTSWSTGGY